MTNADKHADESAGGGARSGLLVSGAIAVVAVIAIWAGISPQEKQKSLAESYPIRIPFAAMQRHALPFSGPLSSNLDRQLMPTGGRYDLGKGAETGKKFVDPEFKSRPTRRSTIQ